MRTKFSFKEIENFVADISDIYQPKKASLRGLRNWGDMTAKAQ
jgi:hypothetical protein